MTSIPILIEIETDLEVAGDVGLDLVRERRRPAALVGPVEHGADAARVQRAREVPRGHLAPVASAVAETHGNSY